MQCICRPPTQGLQVIKRAPDLLDALLGDMSVNLSRFTALVPEQFLDIAQIGSGSEQMGGIRMTKPVKGNLLPDARLRAGHPEYLLHTRGTVPVSLPLTLK